jgi:hypothetical protein
MPVYNYGYANYQTRSAASKPKRWMRWFKKNGAAADSAPSPGPGHVQ